MIKSTSQFIVLPAYAAMVLLLLLAVNAENRDVLVDFRQTAAREGWLLAKLNNSRGTVLLISTGSEQNLRLRPEYSVYQFTSSASGNCIAFSISPSVPQMISSWDDLFKDMLFIVGPNGNPRSTKGHFVTVKAIALSPDCQKLTIDGIYQQLDPVSQKITSTDTGLFWTNVGSDPENVRLIAHAPSSTDYMGATGAAFDVSWSPHNDIIAYSVNGAIYTYNTVSTDRELLGPGKNPTWSPNRRWVGYRGLDGTPMLLDVERRRNEPLVRGAKCLWSIKWSPDSRFAIFAQYDRVGTVFQVCRLNDRTFAPMYYSGAQFTEARFGWVTRSALATLLAPGERIKNE